MRHLNFIAPLAATLAVATAAAAQPYDTPEVTVTVGGDLTEQVEKLGERDVQLKTQDLAERVTRELAGDSRFAGAQVRLVLTDLKPNRPTFQQALDRPGLSIFDSISIGGATIEGEIVTAGGERLPIRYSRYSSSIRDVYGYNTWQDADRAFARVAENIAEGRLVTR